MSSFRNWPNIYPALIRKFSHRVNQIFMSTFYLDYPKVRILVVEASKNEKGMGKEAGGLLIVYLLTA